MDRQQQIDELVHDLRGNLHAIEMAARLLENSAETDRQRELAAALQAELPQARQNLETLVTTVRARRE